MTKPQISPEALEYSKPKCPDCLQSLTFVRTKSHSRKWYCYSCEKYVDHFAQKQTGDLPSARPQSIKGLQVVDSNGMMIGRVLEMTPTGTEEMISMIVDVDKKPFRTSLRNQGMANSVEVHHENVTAIGDVVILAKPFSSVFSNNNMRSDSSVRAAPVSRPEDRGCPDCGSPVSPDSRFCIICGRRLTV